MQQDLSYLSRLRELLFSMEQDLGLTELSQNEKDILYVVAALSSEGNEQVRTEEIKQHQIVAEMPPATFHRALKSLLERKIISHPPRRKAGLFVLNDTRNI